MPVTEKSLDLWALAEYEPHVAQRAVHDTRARTICLKWARRGGKGRCATFKLLDIYLQEAKHRRPRSLVPSFHAGIVAPTYRNAEQAWMDLQAFVPEALTANINHQSMQMWLKPYGMLGTGLIEVRSADNEPCHDEETEVLTARGFIPWRELTMDDTVATRNPRGALEYQRPEQIFAYDAKPRSMVRLKSRGGLDALVTSNHRLLVDRRRKKSFELVPADSVHPSRDRIPKTCLWEGQERDVFLLPYLKGSRTRPAPILMDDWLAFLGIFLADGCVVGHGEGLRRKKNYYQVSIAQKAGWKREKIRALMEKLPFKYFEHGDLFSIFSVNLWHHLLPLGGSHTKYVSPEYKELSRRQLTILFDWLMLGDGHQHSGRVSTYNSVSRRLADDVQEIAVKLGYSPRIVPTSPTSGYIRGRLVRGGSGYRVKIKTSRFAYLSDARESYVSREPYEGRVYCCSVPNGTVLTRRNGTLLWSGNSLQNWGLDVLWITEAQDVPASAYHKVLPARYSPGRAGILIAEGIPPISPDHWFNTLYEKGQTDAFHLYFSSKLTYLENPLLKEDERAGILAARDFMSDSEWRRHFLAEDPTDTERPMDIRRVLVAREDWDKAEPVEGQSYVAGLDLGKKVDATVLTIWDKTTWKLVYLRRITLMDWVVQKESFLEAADRWQPEAIRIDSTGLGDPMYDELAYAGLPVVPVVITSPERERLLNKLAVAIERKKIIVPYDDALVREFDAMRRVRVSTQNVRWQASEGHHDDIVFSCALALSDMPLRDGGAFERRPPDYYGWETW